MKAFRYVGLALVFLFVLTAIPVMAGDWEYFTKTDSSSCTAGPVVITGMRRYTDRSWGGGDK
ncbi:MAG TPA: hypothetical protein VM537_27970, partial [Anaerolineae bacterium]|nr:hypothetical protein [Anaerolineae bacterium]